MDPVKDAALEREIERVLAVDPSPEFLVRVRARIADEPAPASRGFGWLFAGVATVAAAAALVLAVRMVSPARPPAAAPLLASRSIGSAVVVPAVVPATAGQAGHDGEGPAKAGHYVPNPARLRNRQYVVSGFSRTSGGRTAATRTPEPLFDARETTALQRLIADVRDARVDLTPLAKEGPMRLPAMDPLVISPIVIEPLASSSIEGERP